MDWGLLDANAGDNRFLREETVYALKVGPGPTISAFFSYHCPRGRLSQDADLFLEEKSFFQN